jgi:hypothetical protein
MPKRTTIPSDTELEVLTKSSRRCCVCFGLNRDFDEKKGQVAHLDRDPSNANFDNLAYLCMDHHDEYDSRRSQSKGLTYREVKEYRRQLYEAVSEMRNTFSPKNIWPVGLDVPKLKFFRPIDPTPGIATSGIQFTDADPSSSSEAPTLYLSVYFKRTRYFGPPLDSNEKWLYLEANMRPALNLRIQVRAWNERDVEETVRVLRTGVGAYDLHGPQPEEDHAGDYFYVWRENDEIRTIMSTFTSTNAGISIHARLSDEIAKAFANYLENIGFVSPAPS